MKGMPFDYEPPAYPPHCGFSISQDDLKRIGADGGEPGHELRLSAMGYVTSTYHGIDDCRIELSCKQFAGDNGKFIKLETPLYLCLCGPELEKMGLDPNAERGDMIHLIGIARLESRSSSEYGGDMSRLQITNLTFEDESAESRAG